MQFRRQQQQAGISLQQLLGRAAAAAASVEDSAASAAVTAWPPASSGCVAGMRCTAQNSSALWQQYLVQVNDIVFTVNHIVAAHARDAMLDGKADEEPPSPPAAAVVQTATCSSRDCVAGSTRSNTVGETRQGLLWLHLLQLMRCWPWTTRKVTLQAQHLLVAVKAVQLQQNHQIEKIS